MTDNTIAERKSAELPPILRGQVTKEVEQRVRQFVFSVAAIYGLF